MSMRATAVAPGLALRAQHAARWPACSFMPLTRAQKLEPNIRLLLQGWSPERSMRLGGAMLEAVLAVVPQLR